MTQNDLLQLVSNNLKYGAYVYTQLSTPNETWQGNYKIDYLYEQLPDNCLIFMVPKYSSLNGTNRLTIRFLIDTKIENGIKRGVYSSKSYNIYVENSEGTLTPAAKGDIIANRLSIFRFIKGDSDSVILINSPIYNSISLSTLSVTNKAAFYSRPVIVDTATQSEIPVATKTDVSLLEQRIAALEAKIQYGTKDAEEVLLDAPLGTIYIKVEEGE